MYDDIKNALTDEGLQQQRLVYKYPENELEKTLVVPNLSMIEKNSEVQGDEEMKTTRKKTKKESKLISTSSIWDITNNAKYPIKNETSNILSLLLRLNTCSKYIQAVIPSEIKTNA